MIAAELPIAADAVSIVDLETTGLSAAMGERVVEVSVVRVPREGDPLVVFDTLVHPGGPVRGTSIHGITDDDVEGAPFFWEIAPQLLAHLEGTVVATYNAAFDMAFIESELSLATRGAFVPELPYLCLMWMRPQLGVGPRCPLSTACEHLGIPGGDHSAREDSVAAARLWRHYLDVAERGGARTFDQLRSGRRGKFWDSLNRPVLQREAWSLPHRPGARTALKPRGAHTAPLPAWATAQPVDRHAARRAYWHALLDVMEDDTVSDAEVRLLAAERRRLQLSPADVRAVHAKFFGNRLEALAADEHVSEDEDRELQAVHAALRRLGWAPGA